MSTNPEGTERPRIRSTGYDAALVRAEQRAPGPVRPGPSTAHLGYLTAAHEHASGQRVKLIRSGCATGDHSLPLGAGSAALCTFSCPLCSRIPKRCSLHTGRYAAFDAF